MNDIIRFMQTFTQSPGAGIPVAELYSLWEAYGTRELSAGEFKSAVKDAGYAVGLLPVSEDKRAQHYLDLEINDDALAEHAAAVRKHPLAECERCPLAGAAYIPTDTPNAEIMFVGEAPNYQDAMAGRPGMTLYGLVRHNPAVMDGVMSRAGMTNMVACKPQSGTTAPPEAIRACQPRLHAELEGTSRVVALGATPAKSFTGQSGSIQELRQRGLRKREDGLEVLPTYSPGYTLASPRYQADLQADLQRSTRPIKRWVEPKAWIPESEERTIRMLESLRGPGILALDIETAQAPKVPGKKLGVLITKPRRIRAIGITNVENDVLILRESHLQSPTVRLVLSQVLHERDILAHNGKFDLQVLEHLGYGRLDLAADTMLAGYLLDTTKGGKSLEAMAMQYVDSPAWKDMLSNPDGEDWTYDNVPDDVLHDYLARDVANTLRVWNVIRPMVEELGLSNAHTMLCQASDMLGRAERAGLALDRYYHAKVLERLSQERTEALAALREAVGREDFNPGSHVQVKDAIQRFTGSRPSSTARNALVRMQQKGKAREVIDPLLRYRKVDKLIGTYLGPLRKMTYRGRVHANFHLHRTDTGRLSSSDPNFQNIPKAERQLFVAGEGMVYVSTDVAQAELRVIAVESGDSGLAEVFRTGADVHGEVASQLYGSGFTAEQRRRAKTIVFGIAYGRSAYGIAQDPSLGMDEDEAQALIDAYYSRFPRVRDWQDSIRQAVRNGEPLRTKFGRIYRVPPRNTRMDKYQLKQFERAAMSFVPQSTASDITLRAAIILDRTYEAPIRVLVHDEITLEVPQEHGELWAQRTRDALTQAGREYTLEVPFVSESDITKRWAGEPV